MSETSHAAEQAPVRSQFADLLAAAWDRAYRFAFHLTGNAQEAEDVLQQAAEEAFVAFDRFQPGTRFDRWLMRILHNSYLDRVRHERRRKVFSLDDVSTAVLAAGRTTDPEAVLEDSLDGPVRQALDALPPDFRTAVVLVDILELSYEDAAHILQSPIGTVRSRLHRGRLALREWLRPYVDAQKREEL